MRLLHAGCGGAGLPVYLEGRGYEEVRLDVDPTHKPHIVANLTDMGDIGQFDVVYTSHCLEHLYPEDVKVALGEMYRVTKPGGFVFVIVPDLEGVKATDEILIESPAGDLSGLDLIYGCRYCRDNEHMAHHSGFVSATLEAALRAAGFARIEMRRLPDYNLMGLAWREAVALEEAA